jgi:signal transduction histidine kinase
MVTARDAGGIIASILVRETEFSMKKTILVSAAALSMLAFTFAQSLAGAFGTAAEARAMLDLAIAQMKTDEAAALARFNDPKGAFRDRDLYVFCAAAADARLVAHPSLVGTDLRTIKDKTGKPFGQEMMDVAVEDKVVEVTYLWPRPGETEAVAKDSYVTKVGEYVCGVGYYR